MFKTIAALKIDLDGWNYAYQNFCFAKTNICPFMVLLDPTNERTQIKLRTIFLYLGLKPNKIKITTLYRDYKNGVLEW